MWEGVDSILMDFCCNENVFYAPDFQMRSNRILERKTRSWAPKSANYCKTRKSRYGLYENDENHFYCGKNASVVQWLTALETAQLRLLVSLCGGHEKEGVRNHRQARLWCKFNDSWTSQPYSLVFGVLSVISRRWPLLSTPPHFDMQRHSLPL